MVLGADGHIACLANTQSDIGARVRDCLRIGYCCWLSGRDGAVEGNGIIQVAKHYRPSARRGSA